MVHIVDSHSLNGHSLSQRRYGYDNTTFSPHPILSLSGHLTDIAQSMPIHLLPGKTDPAGTILPQQPFPRAMFGLSAAHSSFCCETNPAYIRVVSDADDPAYQGPDTRPGP